MNALMVHLPFWVLVATWIGAFLVSGYEVACRFPFPLLGILLVTGFVYAWIGLLWFLSG